MPIVDLMSELPYAAALTADYIRERCLLCFRLKTGASIRCDLCGVAIYCDTSCRERDAFDHEPECRAYRNFGAGRLDEVDNPNEVFGDEKIRLLARIIRRHRRDGGNADLTSGRPQNVKLRKLSDLMSHRDELLRDPVRSVHLQQYASDLYGYFAKTTEEFSPFYTTVDEIEEYVGKMCVNCFGVSVTTVDDEQHIGVAVYLTSSRFDHTCKPNLFMDFEEGNRIIYRYYYENEGDKAPDYDRLSVSYGYTPMYAGFTAVPTRQQRQLSLWTRYYFHCTCQWCEDETDTDMSEAATTRLCQECRKPFVFRPDHEKGFILKQTCLCAGQEEAEWKDCFEEKAPAKDLDRLLKEWSTTFHPSEHFRSAADAIAKVEPLRRLAHKYWHPVLNLRYVQLNEALFHAYRSIALSGCPPNFTASPTIFPIPESRSINSQDRTKSIIAGCIAGEMVMAAYEKRLEPYETVVARFCYQLAEMYELRKNTVGALNNYERALRIWRHHGARGADQCKAIGIRIERLPKAPVEKPVVSQSASSAIAAGLKKMELGETGDKEHLMKETPKDDEAQKASTENQEASKKKKHRKKKK